MIRYVSVSPGDAAIKGDAIKLYGPEAFAGMRRAGRVTAGILDALAEKVVPGVSTGDLDDFCREEIDRAGAVAANIGYNGYRHASCISLNHVVCRGIPGDRTLKPGDILNIDLTSTSVAGTAIPAGCIWSARCR